MAQIIKMEYEFENISEIITKGSSDLTERENFRPPSIRGQLRFWFRATIGAHLKYIQMLELEKFIFGTNDFKGLIAIRTQPLTKPNIGRLNKRTDYITFAYRNRNVFCYKKGNKFKLIIIINKKLLEINIIENEKLFPNFSKLLDENKKLKKDFSNFIQNIIHITVEIFALFGGIGQRIRRYYGAIKINKRKINEDIIKNIVNNKELKNILLEIKKYLENYNLKIINNDEKSEFPVIFKDFSLYIKKCSNRIYEKILEYCKDFPDNILKRYNLKFSPELKFFKIEPRIFFGLPKPYYIPSTRQTYILNCYKERDRESKEQRRASPIIYKPISIQGKIMVCVYIFESKFLPNYYNLKEKKKHIKVHYDEERFVHFLNEMKKILRNENFQEIII